MKRKDVIQRIGVALGAKQSGTPVNVGEPGLDVRVLTADDGPGMVASFSLQMLPHVWQVADPDNLTVADLEALRSIVNEMFGPPEDVEPEDRAQFDLRPKILPIIEACILELEGNIS